MKIHLQKYGATDWFHFAFLLFCFFLPFQFALNPFPGIDLAIARVVIPLFFAIWLFLTATNNIPRADFSWTTLLICIFLVLATASLFFSHNLAWSARKLLFLFSIFPVYFVAQHFSKKINSIRSAMSALIGGASLLALVGIVQFSLQFILGIDKLYAFWAQYIIPFFLGNSFSKSVLAYPSWLVNSEGTTYLRAFAVFPDPHMFSYYLGMLLPWSIALWATSIGHKRFFLFSSIILAVANVMSFTRGGYVALIASAIIAIFLVPQKAKKIIFMGIAIFALAFFSAPHGPVAGRFSSSFDIAEGSNQGRISNWNQALGIITNHPLGVGIGMYSLAINSQADYREPIYAHDLYLDIAAELGIESAIVFILLLFLAIKSFWKSSRNNPLAVAGAASLLVFFFHSFVETPLYSVHVLTLLLIILAVSTNIKKNENPV